jgi:YVTN family beta-propeller protein
MAIIQAGDLANISDTLETEDFLNSTILTKIGGFNGGGAEITAFDPETKVLFVVTGGTSLQRIDFSNPNSPSLLNTLDLTSFGSGATSVAIENGVVAIAIQAIIDGDPSRVVFYTPDGTFLSEVTVGVGADMLTFTPDGQKVVVANEGEPNDLGDPVGSLSVIDLSGGAASLSQGDVTTVGFEGFNGQEMTLRALGVRLFPEKTVAEDLEPEYVAISPDGTKAFVTLQENNAIAVLDLTTNTVESILPLGVKDFSQPGNSLDASDRDGGINLKNYPVFGLYQPDAIAAFTANGQTYYMTANEGDTRTEDVRVKDIVLDPTVFPDAATLQQNSQLGRLLVSSVDGDTDGDGDYDQLFTYGARSFSIWDAAGNLVYDSGDDFEELTAQLAPEVFNSDGSAATVDTRSDNKGPEPEGVTIGIVDGQTLAFIGLERTGGVMVYNVSNPQTPEFLQYLSNPAGDISPEGLTFIAAEESPSGKPLLVIANEVSGTVSVNEVDNVPTPSTFTLQLLHAADQEAGIPALEDAPRFSAILNALKDDYENTLLLSSGDALIPGVFSNTSTQTLGAPGRADILIQNELGFQAIAFGNHEFDLGTAAVRNYIRPDANFSYGGSLFPYLSTNLDFSTDSNLADLVVADGQAPLPNSIAGSVVIDVNGESIGVVGATTPTLGTISSPGTVGVNPIAFDSADPADIQALAAVIQESVDALTATGINKVVLLTHMQQIAIEEQLAGFLKDVDIIVAGGSNTLLADETDRLRAGDSADGVYPILKTAADGNPVAVVNTDGNYKYVGRLVVDFDAAGVILPSSIDPTISGAYATDDQGVTDLEAEALVDPEIQAITDDLREVILAQDGSVFGVTDVFLNGSRGDVRTQETNLGNLTADANLSYAQSIDNSVVISIKNGGGIRDNIGRIVTPTEAVEPVKLPPEGNSLTGKPEGGISQIDIQNTLRFNNGLTLVSVTASELLALIEHGVSASADGATPGQFPQVAGLAFSFDDDLPAGNRVQSLAITDADGNPVEVIARNGEVVGDPDRLFRVVTLGFLADGGDGYLFPNRDRVNLTQPDTAPRTGEATFANDGSEQDALAEYLVDNFPQATPFAIADADPTQDERIQNLDFRGDTVLEGLETPLTSIFEIQGADHVSALVGETVITQGIVTAVGFNGFYLQDPNGDGNTATSDGIFVLTGSRPSLNVGDSLEVEGLVTEFVPGGAATGNLSTTQLTNATITAIASLGTVAATTIGSSGRVPPNQVIDDDGLTSFDPETDGIDFYESLEGMLVTVETPVAISGTRRFSAFSSEVFTLANGGANLDPADGRTGRGGLNLTPFDPALAPQLRDLNPERIQIQFDGTLFPGSVPALKVGDQLSDVTGVVGYSFGNYEVNAIAPVTVTPSDLEAETTELIGTQDQLTVASYNVLNLNPLPATNAQRATLANQIVNNLATPDIIALQEIQDNDGTTNGTTSTVTDATETLQALVEAIAAAGGPQYAFTDVAPIDDTSGGVPGGNIRNAYLYNPERVSLNSVVSLTPEVLTTAEVSVPGAFTEFADARNPLLAEFEFNGSSITLINNHLTSRFGSSPTFGATQPIIEAGEAAREAQVQALKEYVDFLLAADPSRNVGVLGDFNTFQFTNDLAEILPGTGDERVLSNLVNTLTDDNVYSFIFEGNSQVLDHFFVTDQLLTQAEFDIVHTNVDFPQVDNTVGSDHDPLLARFKLNNTQTGTSRSDRLVGTATQDIQTGLGGNDTLLGRGGNDTQLGQGGKDLLLGESGNDILSGGRGSDTLKGGNENDTLFGNEGDDQLLGDFGNDLLQGDRGQDSLWGGRGDDTLRGGLGQDTLFGQSGADLFVLSSRDRMDRIQDFELAVDSIGLADGLTLAQLSFVQQGNHALIRQGTSTLAIVMNSSPELLTQANFQML